MSILTNNLNKEENYKTAEQLAETYFPQARQKERSSPQPVKVKKGFAFAITALSIAIILISLTLIYIFSINAINIDITVNKKENFPYQNFLHTQQVSLLGGAFNEGESGQGYIALINDGTEKRIGVAIDLKEPLDFSRSFLLINTVPKKGGGHLKVILRDRNFKSYVSNVLEVRGAEGKWQNFIITAKETQNSIEIQRIDHIRLELDKNTTRDKEGSAIYIRNVALINN